MNQKIFLCGELEASLRTVKLFSWISRPISSTFRDKILLAPLSFLIIIFIRKSLRCMSPRVDKVESASVMFIPPLGDEPLAFVLRPFCYKASWMSRNLVERRSFLSF